MSKKDRPERLDKVVRPEQVRGQSQIKPPPKTPRPKPPPPRKKKG